MEEAIDILGCPLHPLDRDQAVEAILRYAREGRGAQIVTLGTEMVVYAQSDPAYREVLRACTLALCDTIGLLAVARARGAPMRERVTGVDLIEQLCARAAQEGIAVYLLGGAPGVSREAANVLAGRYPGLRVAGARDGYFSSAESETVAREVGASGAQLLFVGMGFPRQEFWLAENLSMSGCGAGIGVGGSFDVIAGRVQRAPKAWQDLGLEWLYRLVTQPHRWRRQLALPIFVALIAADALRARVTKGGRR